MVDQTQISGTRPGRVRRNLAGLAHDALSLAELQGQLFVVDLRDMRRGVTAAGVLIAAGAVLALGCLPVLLMAGGELLVEVWRWTPAGAYATAGGAALLVASGLIVSGWRMLSRSMKTMERSRNELAATVRWLKESLRAADDGPVDLDWDAPWSRL